MVYNYRGFNFNDLTITDDQHINTNAMSEDDVQQFFQNQGSFLANFITSVETGEGFLDANNNGDWDAGEPVYDRNGNGIFDGGTLERASMTFFREAQANGINPQLLIVTAQKENQLITRRNLPTSQVLNNAMGCGSSSNFRTQVRCAAETFRNRFNDLSFNGRPVTYPFFFRASDGITHRAQSGQPRVAVSFAVHDASTYAQYRYTPHIQAEATGGGVYLFEVLWEQYFGPRR